MAAGKDLYGDLERIEARAKRKRHQGLSSRLFSVFGRKDEEEEDENGEEKE
jgi:hypothetical protein